MNLTRISAVSLFVLFILFVFAMPDPEIGEKLKQQKSLAMPWHITIHDDNSSEVLGLRLGHSRLQDAINRFNEPEDIAVYLGNEKSSLEAYLGTVHLGPLKGKMVLTLEATQQELQQIMERSAGRTPSGSTDKKLKLSQEDALHSLDRVIIGITYIPAYSSLDTAFFTERFGQPHSWQQLSESAVQYYYPAKGLSIVIDDEGKEVLQYSSPARFDLPADAVIKENTGPSS